MQVDAKALIGSIFLAVSLALSATAPLALAISKKPVDVAQPTHAAEMKLVGFKMAILAADFPAKDLALSPAGELWILGQKHLWQWRFADGWLRKVDLPEPADRLTFDGVSVYAAGPRVLFQYQTVQKRLFSYGIPGTKSHGAPPFGFSGQGDDLWFLHPAGLMHIDRYGKTLARTYPMPAITNDDLVEFDPATRTLWRIHDRTLSKTVFSSDEGVAPLTKAVLTTKHKLLELALAGQQVVLHTERSVLRVDMASGKTRKAIPVEGSSKLVAMGLSASRHGYLFENGLLEIFDMQAKTSFSTHLDDDRDHPAAFSRLVLAGKFAAILDGTKPRAFQLNP